MAKISRSCYFPESVTNLEKKISFWIGDIYKLFLEELEHGNIHPILLDILDEEEFQRCFGFTIETFFMSHIRQPRK